MDMNSDAFMYIIQNSKLPEQLEILHFNVSFQQLSRKSFHTFWLPHKLLENYVNS